MTVEELAQALHKLIQEGKAQHKVRAQTIGLVGAAREGYGSHSGVVILEADGDWWE